MTKDEIRQWIREYNQQMVDFTNRLTSSEKMILAELLAEELSERLNLMEES